MKTDNTPIEHRYDIVYFFDISDGNPNGDPDAGNLPRIDPETGQGLVTDVCLKRKIRNYVGLVMEEKPPFEIYVKEKAVLNAQNERAYKALGEKTEKRKMPKDEKKARELTQWMCQNFFDVRAFGAVMSTDVNCGQVRGPVQFGFARSIDSVVSAEFAITRCAVTTETEAEKQQGDNRTMGRKFAIPYGLYRVHGYISPSFAGQTGFNQGDLDLLKNALNMMFENDKSAARADMRPCRCVVFKHESKLGNARSDQLFSCVTANRTNGDAKSPPRCYADYEIAVDKSSLPSGVEVQEWI